MRLILHDSSLNINLIKQCLRNLSLKVPCKSFLNSRSSFFISLLQSANMFHVDLKIFKQYLQHGVENHKKASLRCYNYRQPHATDILTIYLEYRWTRLCVCVCNVVLSFVNTRTGHMSHMTHTDVRAIDTHGVEHTRSYTQTEDD